MDATVPRPLGPVRRVPRPILVGWTAALLLSGALTGCSGTSDSQAGPNGTGAAPAPSVGTDLQKRYQEVVDEVLPSVVQITTSEGLGSGVVYDHRGHIVTNAHVVGKAKRFQVTLATGGDPLKATLTASYPDQDLAVIQLSDPPKKLHPAVFGDSSRVEVGQIVLAMGNPLGLSSSVTQGIVSAVGRSVSEGEGKATIGNMVQTSAAINPGNSGGALVNLSGQVIGIPTLAAQDPGFGDSPAPGIGFAIPAATTQRLANQMVKHGKVVDPDRAALGVLVRTVLGEGFKPAGAAVVRTTDDSAAERAGIRPGDVLVKVEDDEVTDVVTLSEALAAHRPGDTVEVAYVRDGERKKTSVKLGES